MHKKSTLAIALCGLLSLHGYAQQPATEGQWRGSLTAGLSGASGNTNSLSFNIGADAVKATVADKWSLYFTALYGTKDDSGEKTQTANQARGGARYDYNLSEKTFVFGSLDLERDKLQLLDLRSVAGTGLGTHVVKTPETTFDLFGGLSYNHEKFTTETRDSIELLFGEEFSHKLSETTSFKHRLVVYPSLRERGELRAVLDASLVTALSARINLQITLSDRYVSNPQPGIKRNDFLFITGINVTFGPKN